MAICSGRPIYRVVEGEPGEPGLDVLPEDVDDLLGRAGGDVRATLRGQVLDERLRLGLGGHHDDRRPDGPLDRGGVPADLLAVADQELVLVAQGIEPEREPMVMSANLAAMRSVRCSPPPPTRMGGPAAWIGRGLLSASWMR